MLLSRLQDLIGGIYDVRIAHDVYDFLVTDRERLPREDPLTRLHAGNVADCWTALEGVSHFLYLAWNAGHDRPVSLLELEMQAEVDKYVASYWLLRRQFPGRFPAELRRVLFERTRVDPRSEERRAALYREASRYAEKF